jgi:hypothetical protein
MKHVLILLFFIFGINAFSQIKIEDVGDNWRSKVTEALVLIKNTDTQK